MTTKLETLVQDEIANGAAPALATNETVRELVAAERNFAAALATFIERAQAMLDEHRAKHYPNNCRRILSAMPGPRYVRVVVEDDAKDDKGQPISRSAYCFVAIDTGDVLKPAGWKGPAKGVRGNIYAEDPTSGVTPYGAKYAR